MLRRDGAIAPLAECPPLGRAEPARGARDDDARDPGAAHAPSTRAATSTSPTRPTGLPRFRVNAFRQRGAISFAFRVIPRDVPELRAAEPAAGRRGGSPRSTAASCSSRARPARARRRRSPRCSTTSTARATSTSSRSRTRSRSSIPTATASSTSARSGSTPQNFAQALRRVLRQDPDTILIGELRDAETAQTALQAAESGHLVFSTLHTIDAAETVGRMIEFFPPAKQQQIRSVLAGVLRGVISQRLLPRARRRPRRRRRGDGDERAHRRPDPRGAHRGDPRRDRRGRLLRDADLRAGADRARARRHASSARSPPTPSTNHHDFLVSLDHAIKRQTPPGRAGRRPRRRRPRPRTRLRRSASSGPAGADEARIPRRAAAVALAARRRHGVRGELRGRPDGPGGARLPVAAEQRGAQPARRAPAAAGRLRRALPARRRALLRGAARALAARRRRLRDPLAGARGDQQDRDPTSAATWARARPAPSAGCSSCPTPGCAGEPTATATASPTRGTPRTASSRPRATSPPPGAHDRHLRARSSPTTMPSGTSTTCSSSPRSSAAGGGGDVVFTLDRLAIALDEAQATVASLARSCRRGGRASWSRRRRRGAVVARRRLELLLSDRLGRRAGRLRADQERAAATAEVERLRGRARRRRGGARGGAERRPRGVLRAGRGRSARDADARRRLRLPGRRRAGVGLGRAPPPRLSRGGHRRADGRARLRARRRRRAGDRRRRALRHRADARARSTGSSGSTATSPTATASIQPGTFLDRRTVGRARRARPATRPARTCTSGSARRAIRRRCRGSRSSPGSPSPGRTPPRRDVARTARSSRSFARRAESVPDETSSSSRSRGVEFRPFCRRYTV